MPLPEATTAELEGMRTRLLELLEPLQREEDGSPADEQALRHSLWSAVQALEPLLRGEHVPVELDLGENDEATRQILYDFVVWDYFTSHALEDPGDITVPGYTPEECGLRVFFEAADPRRGGASCSCSRGVEMATCSSPKSEPSHG